MNFLAATGLFNTVVCGGLAFLVFYEKPKTLLAKTYGFFNLAIALWSLAYTGWQCAGTALAARSLLRWTVFFGFWPNTLFLLFAFSFTGMTPQRRRIIACDLLIKSLLSIVNACGWLVPSVSPRAETGLWGDPTPWLTFTICLWQLECVYGFLILIQTARQMDREKRNRLYYVLVALVIGHIGAFSNWLPWYGIHFPARLNGLVCLCSAILGYAILKYQLIDIRIVLRRTLTYSVLSAILIAMYVAIINVFSRNLDLWHMQGSLSSALAAAVIALLFHPLHVHIQRWIDRHFPREALNPHMLREATGTFVHEMKRPLANISMPAQLVLADIHRLQQGEQLPPRALDQIAERLHYIIDQSLDAGAQMEAIRNLSSQTPLISGPLAVAPFLKQALSKENRRLTKERIDSRIADIPEDLTVAGDRAELLIAVGNIIKNAIDALSTAPEDRPRFIHLSAHESAAGIAIEIANSGPPISEKDIARIFDPWVTTKGVKGTGIGLYLTREILARHHATIDVKNGSDNGVCFHLFFPKNLLKNAHD